MIFFINFKLIFLWCLLEIITLVELSDPNSMFSNKTLILKESPLPPGISINLDLANRQLISV